MSVMSLRLSESDDKKIRSLARAEDKEKSKVARELMLDGLKFKMLVAYRDGKASLSALARALDLSLSEAVDFLASFGLEAPVSYGDYLAGLEAAKKAVH